VRRPDLRHQIGTALDRLGFRTGRELQLAVAKLADEVERLRRPVVFNDSSGDLVVSRYRSVLASRADVVEEVTTVVGPLLLPHFDRFILPSLREYGWWEPDEMAYLRSHLRPGQWAIDVGAHVGFTALVMAEAVGPAGRVIALEPEPLNFDLLCRNVWRNEADQVVPIQSAGGDHTGSAVLERSPDNSGDHRTAPHPLGIGAQGVPMIALDDILPPEQPIHFVATDAQGYDHRVLDGMRKTIDRWRPSMLLEFWPVGILGAGDNPDEVLSDYRSRGYRLALLPDRDVTDLSAEALVADAEKDHVTLALTTSG
jgi:FkbM family methyltransferase